MKIAVLGYGTIGRSICAAIEASAELELKWILELPQFATKPKMTSELSVILEDPEVGIVCDVLPGTHPSYEYMKAALAAGKHVVTSNKAALCFGFRELLSLAAEKGVYLRYEAACGGTIPNIAQTLKLAKTNEISEIYGIMNGTTNFIIDKMDREGADFDATLKEAQKLGYAEANPTADLSGFDVKNKIVIMSNTAYKGCCTTDFPVAGIEKLTKEILDSFKARGKMVKLLGISRRKGLEYGIGVVPVLMSAEKLEAHVPKNFNLFTIVGDSCGEVKLYGQGAGGTPTADAIMRDLFEIVSAGEKQSEDYFSRELVYKPELLKGRGYYAGKVAEGTLEELVKAAQEADAFLAFEPEEL